MKSYRVSTVMVETYDLGQTCSESQNDWQFISYEKKVIKHERKRLVFFNKQDEKKKFSGIESKWNGGKINHDKKISNDERRKKMMK